MASSGFLLVESPPDAARPSATASRSLGLNFGWALAGNVFYAASQWTVIVILAKLADPATVGRFALGLDVNS